MAMAFHHAGNNSQAKTFLLEAISLQEQAVAFRSQLDIIETEHLFIELVHSCKDAKKILSDEPEAFQTICGRTIQHIKSCLDENPKRVIFLSTLEYHLVVLYLLKGKDLIKDSIPVVGYLDDIAVTAAAFKLSENELAAYEQWRAAKAAAVAESAVEPAGEPAESIVRTAAKQIEDAEAEIEAALDNAPAEA